MNKHTITITNRSGKWVVTHLAQEGRAGRVIGAWEFVEEDVARTRTELLASLYGAEIEDKT